MSIGEIAGTLYSTGMLAFAIVMLAIAIIVYPTLKKDSHRKAKI